MGNERATDLDLKRQIFRECQGAMEVLARAFAGADKAFPILSPNAARLVESQLLALARRTIRLVDAVAFGNQLQTERLENEVAVPRIDGSGDDRLVSGFGGDSAGGIRNRSGRRDGSGGVLPRVTFDDDLTPEVVMTDPLFVPTDLCTGAVEIARTQLGQREDGPNRGPMVDQYLHSVGLSPGNPWCGAFVHYCFQMAANALGMLNPCPKTGGVLALWERAPDACKVSEPAVGSVVIMDHGKGHGHTGIIESVNGGGLVETIEGNSNQAGSREGDSVVRHIFRPEDNSRGKLVGYLDFSRIPLVSRKSAAT